MRLTEEDMGKRRQTIIQTAFRLFCDHGIERVPLSEVAKQSKLSENTIYRYFGNKEQLVLEAFVKLWDLIMQRVEQIVAGVPNYAGLTGFGQIRVWLESFRRLYQVDQDFVLFSYEAKLYLLRKGIRLDRFQQDTLMQSFRGPCLAALEKGRRDGSIPARESEEDLFYAIWGTIRGYVVKIVIYGQLFGEDSPWESRYEVVERGILCALRAGWRVPEY